jgi:predicted secreted hydrolase
MKKGTIYLNARHRGIKVELTLQPEKPPVLHGQGGLSRKGPADGQSSYYYSITDLKTCGSIKTPLSNKSVNVKGLSWFDQEFGSNQLTAEQVGWDWFGIHLSDGRDLMVYFLRKKDGTVEATSSGTIVEKSGSSGHLRLSDIHVDILDKWKSPKTGGIYPARWRIRIPSVHVDIIITPCIADQELATGFPVGIIYWEGAIEGKGTSEDKPVTVEGYVELTGYAGSIGGTF